MHRIPIHALLIAMLASPADALTWIERERWVAAVDRAAHDAVTWQICGWGEIDLRSRVLQAAETDGVETLTLDGLARRFDATIRDRQTLEAQLARQPDTAPPLRRTGLFATGGCATALRDRIASAPYRP